jgi:hypothetical protein
VFDPLAIALIIAFNGLIGKKKEKTYDLDDLMEKNYQIYGDSGKNSTKDEETPILVTKNDTEVFFDAIENPPVPSEELIKAAEKYKEQLLQTEDIKKKEIDSATTNVEESEVTLTDELLNLKQDVSRRGIDLDGDGTIDGWDTNGDGLIDEINYKIYLKFYTEYRNEFELYGMVYLNTDATVCYDRVKKRSREGEESVSLDYLEKCKKYHEDWLCDGENILIIDANEDVQYDIDNEDDKGAEWLERIKEYISEIKNNDGSTTTADIDDADIQEFDKTSIWSNLINKFMKKV